MDVDLNQYLQALSMSTYNSTSKTNKLHVIAAVTDSWKCIRVNRRLPPLPPTCLVVVRSLHWSCCIVFYIFPVVRKGLVNPWWWSLLGSREFPEIIISMLIIIIFCYIFILEVILNMFLYSNILWKASV